MFIGLYYRMGMGDFNMKLVKKSNDGRHLTLKVSSKKMIHHTQQKAWKVLIVDDEPDIHTLTCLSLKDFEFAGRSLQFLHANTSLEARHILTKETDIAVVLVDIVMETDDAGLHLINYIRNDLHNNQIRIMVRTGQPGLNLERTVIEQYDIDDYKNKSELNADKLYFSMRVILKGYRNLLALKESNQSLELKVQKRTQQLEQQNRALVELNRDKNEFLGITAHDLKNPLQAIQGSAELIPMLLEDESFPTKSDILEYSNMISVSAERMFDLVTNLLDVNAIESGKLNIHFQHVDILPTLYGIVDEYRKKAQSKQIQIDFNPHCAHYLAETDISVIHQIMDNLVSNAVKYSPLGKHIFVEVVEQQKMVELIVQDQGQGLSPDDHARLFGKFTRLSAKPTDIKDHSTGLGLFIVKKLVTALRGSIHCESELGQGARFIVNIPK